MLWANLLWLSKKWIKCDILQCYLAEAVIWPHYDYIDYGTLSLETCFMTHIYNTCCCLYKSCTARKIQMIYKLLRQKLCCWDIWCQLKHVYWQQKRIQLWVVENRTCLIEVFLSCVPGWYNGVKYDSPIPKEIHYDAVIQANHNLKSVQNILFCVSNVTVVWLLAIHKCFLWSLFRSLIRC